MGRYVSIELRRFVAERAERICEYCLIHEQDTYAGCQIDHVISEKHNGLTAADNLAFACALCNRHKGTDVGSIVHATNTFVRLYNPRIDQWSQHFKLDGPRILSLSEIGEVTVKILRFNDDQSVEERQLLLSIGRYPSPAALRRIPLSIEP